MAPVTAAKIAEDVEQGVQESPSTPVCAYNEWDPLEVRIYHKSFKYSAKNSKCNLALKLKYASISDSAALYYIDCTLAQ